MILSFCQAKPQLDSEIEQSQIKQQSKSMRLQNKLISQIDKSNSPIKLKENIRKADVIFLSQTLTVKSDPLHYRARSNLNHNIKELQLSSEEQKIIQKIEKEEREIQQLCQKQKQIFNQKQNVIASSLDAQLRGDFENAKFYLSISQELSRSLEINAGKENMLRAQILQLKKELQKLRNQKI